MKGIVGEEAKINRPTRRAELRVSGLDEDTGPEEVACRIIQETGCGKEETKMGNVRRNRFGVGNIWIQCPRNHATVLASKGRMMIGWVAARIELLENGPVQCYRCWEYGHLKIPCRGAIDRSKLCYKCGGEGHRAAECKERVKCILCREKGREFGHRIGSRDCYERGEGNRRVDERRRYEIRNQNR